VTLVSALGVYQAAGVVGSGEYSPPLGILTLAALIRDRYAVEIVDLDRKWLRSKDKASFHRSAVEVIGAAEPQVLGFSSVSGGYPETIRLIEECSRRLPDATVVMGGPQASVVDVPTLEAFPFIDFILRGEADETFPMLLQGITQGGEVRNIAGLSYRDGHRIVRNANASPTLDLDGLPLAAYDLLPGIEDLKALPLEIGRGCPFACRFCATNDYFRRRFRLKSAKRTFEQMRQLNALYGVAVFDLVHDMLTVDRRKVVEFCELLIDAGSPFQWSCAARTDCVDRDLLHLMKKAGCADIFFGMETGSQRMQHVIDKNLDLNEARLILREADDAGLLTTASLITGYPEETLEDLRETVRFFSDMLPLKGVDPQINILVALPETPLTTQYKDRLFLDEGWTGIAENGCLQDATDQMLIAAHPDIFPNFYAFPCLTGRDYLRRLRDFLFYGMVRCSGVMQVMYRISKDLLAVFDLWEEHYGRGTHAYYESLQYAQDLLRFAESRYPNDESLAVMARFYRAVLRDAESAAPEPPAALDRPIAALAKGVRLVTTQGDVNAVFRALREGVDPDTASVDRSVTVAIRAGSVNRSEILEFPPVTQAILRHAEKRSTIDEIVRDFQEQDIRHGKFTPEQIVAAAIEMLEKLRLLRILPAAAATHTGSSPKSRNRKRREAGSGKHAPAIALAAPTEASSPFHILDSAASR